MVEKNVGEGRRQIRKKETKVVNLIKNIINVDAITRQREGIRKR